jgi:hypothetical protein
MSQRGSGPRPTSSTRQRRATGRWANRYRPTVITARRRSRFRRARPTTSSRGVRPPRLPAPATATSAPGMGSPLPRLHQDWAHPCHICAATGLAPSHICTGTGLTAATSAPRLRTWASASPSTWQHCSDKCMLQAAWHGTGLPGSPHAACLREGGLSLLRLSPLAKPAGGLPSLGRAEDKSTGKSHAEVETTRQTVRPPPSALAHYRTWT